MADDCLAAKQAPHEAGEVLELGGRDPGHAERVLHRGDAAAEAEHEPTVRQTLHRQRVASDHHGMAGVVVRRPGLDRDALGDRASGPRQRHRLLAVVALGDERGAESECLAVDHLLDDLAGRLRLTADGVEAQLVQDRCDGCHFGHLFEEASEIWDHRVEALEFRGIDVVHQAQHAGGDDGEPGCRHDRPVVPIAGDHSGPFLPTAPRLVVRWQACEALACRLCVPVVVEEVVGDVVPGVPDVRDLPVDETDDLPVAFEDVCHPSVTHARP